MSALDAVRSFLLADAEVAGAAEEAGAARPPAAPAPRPLALVPPPDAGAARVALLAPPAIAATLGVALGVALAAQRRTEAVVAVWGSAPAEMAGPGGSARRVAARLAGRGHDARAAGRLVLVALPDEDAAAAAAATRLDADAGEAPLVLVLAGPRGPALDGWLTGCDRALVVAAGDALADLALGAVARRTVARAARPRVRLLDRALARAGRARRAFARDLLAALEGSP